IGQAIARRAALGFGMPVRYHARRPVDLAAQAPELQGRAVRTPLAELLAQSDFVAAVRPAHAAPRPNTAAPAVLTVSMLLVNQSATLVSTGSSSSDSSCFNCRHAAVNFCAS